MNGDYWRYGRGALIIIALTVLIMSGIFTLLVLATTP